MPGKRKSGRRSIWDDPTPITASAVAVASVRRGGNGGGPPEPPGPPIPDDNEPLTAEEAFAEEVFQAHADKATGYVDMSKLTSQYFADLRARAIAGGTPAGFITTDPTTALDTVNRQEIGQLLIRTRYRRGKYQVRRFMPIIRRDGSRTRQERRWFDGRENEAAHTEWAEARARQGIQSSVRRAEALVTLGAASWDSVRRWLHTEVDAAVDQAEALSPVTRDNSAAS